MSQRFPPPVVRVLICYLLWQFLNPIGSRLDKYATTVVGFRKTFCSQEPATDVTKLRTDLGCMNGDIHISGILVNHLVVGPHIANGIGTLISTSSNRLDRTSLQSPVADINHVD